MAGGIRDATEKIEPAPPGYPALPAGRTVTLPGRGDVFLREVPGPAGAPCLVLLHGLTCTADLNWFAAFGPLGEGYRVVAPDLRGHGGGILPERFSLTDVADDVAALIDELGTGPAVVVGYSMGGAVAQLVQRRHPDHVAGLVLCATAADYRPADARGRFVDQPRRVLVAALGRALPPGLRARLTGRLRSLADGRSRPDDRTSPLQLWAATQLRRSDPFQVAAAGAALRRHDASAWVAELDGPIALVVTTDDDVVPTADQRRLSALLPAATGHEVAAGHGAFVEAPESFVPALVAACAAVTAP